MSVVGSEVRAKERPALGNATTVLDSGPNQPSVQPLKVETVEREEFVLNRIRVRGVKLTRNQESVALPLARSRGAARDSVGSRLTNFD